ncbi:MAG: hypothetical protein NTV34_13710 [Proteobacteria bacterium]|nr:hypothetical protein [Pseudomonadota bacterium]
MRLVFFIILYIGAIAGCSKAVIPEKRKTSDKVAPVENASSRTPAPVPAPIGHPPLAEEVDPLTTEQTTAFFKTKCVVCHDSQNGPLKSFFAIDRTAFAPAVLSTEAIGPTVIYALYKKATKMDSGSPFAMPTGQASDEDRLEIKRLLRWFDLNMPDLVIQSSRKFGFETSLNKVKMITNYTCSSPITFRQLMTRVTADAFDRTPSPQELALFGDDANRTVSVADRANVAKRIFADAAWHQEFLNVGLRKFARKLAGAGQILAYGDQISQAQAIDLQDELYQLILRDIDGKSFKDILLTDSLRVSSATAGFYGCPAPASGWSNCNMESRRKSYFSSMSYLRSTPSSFLIENNNYKRTAMMQFVIQGDVIQPATDGPKGDGQVKALPTCLQTEDFRGVRQKSGAIAPFGSGAIPSHGNLCQSCHIDRYLAAGSMLFRPFNQIGMIFGSGPRSEISADSEFLTAIQEDRVIKKGDLVKPVTEPFLESLLTAEAEKACVTKGTESKNLSTVADLAGFIIGDGRVLTTGLAKHLPRAFSNLSYTSEEILKRVSDSYDATGGKLGPMIEAYFSSETYACARQI